MPTYQIKAPNGRLYEIDGPDGATDEQIQAEVLRQFPESAGEGLEGTTTDDGGMGGDLLPDRDGGPLRPKSFIQGAEEGALKVWNNAARALESGAEWLGIDGALESASGALGMAPTVEDAEAAQQDYFDSTGYEGSTAGKIVGEVAATLPALALPGGPLVQGAAGGALTTDARDMTGIAKDAALGAVMSKGGDLLLRGGARAAAPVMGDEARLLAREGVRLTPGQSGRTAGRTGRAIARQEDKMTSHPFVGDMIDAGRRESVESFNTAAINRSLAPIGEKLPEGMVAGRRAIRHAGDKLSNAYETVLARIQPFTGDAQLKADLEGVQALADDMLPERAQQLNNILGGVGRFIQNGQLDGAGLKEMETRLSQQVRRFSASPDADQQQLGEALEAAREALREAAARANPEQAEALRNINRGWASLVQVERAALSGKNGVFSPNAYSNAVRATDASVRRRGYARGEGLNQDLADAASDVLPSEIADSGTGARWASANMPAMVIGALEALPYAAARRVTTAGADPSASMNAIALGLRRAARYSPVGSTALIEALRNAGP